MLPRSSVSYRRTSPAFYIRYRFGAALHLSLPSCMYHPGLTGTSVYDVPGFYDRQLMNPDVRRRRFEGAITLVVIASTRVCSITIHVGSATRYT